MPSGGKRIGAGKKPGKHGPTVGQSFKLTPDVAAFLREQEPSASAYVDAMIRKSKAFKDWLKSKRGTE